MLKNTRVYFAAAFLSGFLLWGGWPPMPLPVTLLIGFIPLLWIEDTIAFTRPSYAKSELLMYAYTSFLVWNALTTWWIWNATPGGALFAIFANAALMCIPFMLFHLSKKYLNQWLGYTSLVAYWLTFEYLHHLWEFSWPWLTLGNGLAEVGSLIQWYEYTGHLGGSIWLLVLNILLFLGIKKIAAPSKIPISKKLGMAFWKPALLIIIPITISLLIYTYYQPKGKQVEVVVTQPNIDPYGEKFGGMSSDEQLERLLKLSRQKLTDSTDFLVWPETAIQHYVRLSKIEQEEVILKLREFIDAYPNLSLVSGFSPLRIYESRATASETARAFADDKCCLDSYNSALLLAKGQPVQYYHKAKMVPGVERLPYARVFGFLAPLTSDLGGIIGSLGTQPEPTNLRSKNGIKVAVPICYESIFGGFMAKFIRKNADLIFIITNDAWWGNTPGHKQHFAYAPLRAIEHRRSIARSANTGISCFINQRGEIFQATPYWKQAVIRQQLRINKKQTFFTKYGNYLAKLGGLLSAIFIFATLWKRFQR